MENREQINAELHALVAHFKDRGISVYQATILMLHLIDIFEETAGLEESITSVDERQH